MGMFVCELCGRKQTGEFYSEKLEGNVFTSCQECHNKIGDMQSTDFNKQNEALQYLFNCANAQSYSDRAEPFLYKTLAITDNGIKKAKEKEEQIKKDEKDKNQSEVGLSVAGFCFLLLALILYITSVDNQYGVANIQATVFSAAAFVVGCLNIIGARIIKAFKAIVCK